MCVIWRWFLSGKRVIMWKKYNLLVMEKNQKVFRSRISVLLIIILAILLSITFWNKISGGLYMMGVMFSIFIGIGRHYIISGDKLLVKFWFLPNKSVNIEDIVSVERTYNPFSGSWNTMSLKRLRIGLKKRTQYSHWLVSPVREQEFIEELKTVNPDIYAKISDKKGIWRIWDWDI